MTGSPLSAPAETVSPAVELPAVFGLAVYSAAFDVGGDWSPQHPLDLPPHVEAADLVSEGISLEEVKAHVEFYNSLRMQGVGNGGGDNDWLFVALRLEPRPCDDESVNGN